MCTKRQISIICALRILIVSYLWPADDKRGITEDDGCEIHHLLVLIVKENLLKNKVSWFTMGRNKSAAVSLSKLARRGDLSRLQDRNCNRKSVWHVKYTMIM